MRIAKGIYFDTNRNLTHQHGCQLKKEHLGRRKLGQKQDLQQVFHCVFQQGLVVELILLAPASKWRKQSMRGKKF